MDKVYDFNWMNSEIDNSVVLALIKDNKVVSNYQVNYILTSDMNQVEVKFANIDDLEQFVNYAVIRFYDITNKYNIIDIPIRKLKELYDKSNDVEDTTDRKRIKFSDLECFSVINGKTNSEDYSIEVVKFQEVSDEFMKIITICSKYNKMDTMEKFEALGEINLTNYQVEKNSACK